MNYNAYQFVVYVHKRVLKLKFCYQKHNLCRHLIKQIKHYKEVKLHLLCTLTEAAGISFDLFDCS